MLDTIDCKLLDALTTDARASLKELAALVSLSSPSVAERLRRLEERGVVRGFTVEVDPRVLGYQFQAIVHIRPLPGRLHFVQDMLQQIPEVVECDKVTGRDCFIARLYVRSVEELDSVLDRIADKAETETSIVKSQPVRRRLPPLGGDDQRASWKMMPSV